jgi:REP element-mobilizing transposase RayT
MVLGYHVTFAIYGFWLPNDPRGSWSTSVGSEELRRFGPATKTTARHSLARSPHDRTLRLAAKEALERRPVSFTGVQARAVGRGFAEYVRQSGLPVWACSILPEHVHLVLGRFRRTVEQVVIQLKAAATRRLLADDLHPFQPPAGTRPHHCWVRGQWKVFLNAPADIARCVRYVENNPLKDGKPSQVGIWPFVTPPPTFPV